MCLFGRYAWLISFLNNVYCFETRQRFEWNKKNSCTDLLSVSLIEQQNTAITFMPYQAFGISAFIFVANKSKILPWTSGSSFLFSQTRLHRPYLSSCAMRNHISCCYVFARADLDNCVLVDIFWTKKHRTFPSHRHSSIVLCIKRRVSLLVAYFKF